MITVAAARALGVPAPGVAPGSPADLVVLQGRTVRQALTAHAPPMHVVVGGRTTASTTTTTEFQPWTAGE